MNPTLKNDKNLYLMIKNLNIYKFKLIITLPKKFIIVNITSTTIRLEVEVENRTHVGTTLPIHKNHMTF